MSSMKRTQVQFEFMLDFMERNEEHFNAPQGVQGRLENLQKWIELCDVLNTKFKEHAKPLQKWKKAFSDFKNNTKKKMNRIKKHGGKTDLTDVEKRVLKLLRSKRGLKRKPRQSNEGNGVIFKDESEDSSNKSISPSENNFGTIDAQTIHRNFSACSSARSSSVSSSLKSEKREKEYIQDIADKFLRIEKERDRMAHEREMARIKQNDQFLNVMSRIVNVLETLAPKHKKLPRSKYQ